MNELKAVGIALLIILVLVVAVVILARRSAFKEMEAESIKRIKDDLQAGEKIKDEVDAMDADSAADELDSMRRQHGDNRRDS